MSIFRRSRIAVESQLWYRLNSLLSRQRSEWVHTAYSSKSPLPCNFCNNPQVTLTITHCPNYCNIPLMTQFLEAIHKWTFIWPKYSQRRRCLARLLKGLRALFESWDYLTNGSFASVNNDDERSVEKVKTRAIYCAYPPRIPHRFLGPSGSWSF